MTRILIVGAGHAGGRVAQHLADGGFEGEILLVGEEAHAPYERPPLSKAFLLGQQSIEDFSLPDCVVIGKGRFERRRGRVTAVDPAGRTVRLDDGGAIGWDRLVIATGADARRPAIPGAVLPHVHVLRSINDAERLRAAIETADSIAIVGGGVIGLEVASSARELGVRVTVIEQTDRVMARILPPGVSGWLAERHRAAGVDLRLEVGVAAIGADALLLTNDERVPADVVLLASGAMPATAALGGLIAKGSDGVATDAFCRVAGCEHIYAVGDVALTDSPIYGRAIRQETWRNAENQAQAVAAILLGGADPYVELPWMWTDQLGHNIQVVGICDGDREIIRSDSRAGGTCIFHLAGDRIAGAVMIDAGRERRQIERLIRDRVCVTQDQLTGAPLKSIL
ncbi:phenylpropionate dioxygenase ferredoxin reductase subunit [Sphingobium sp. AP50]|uniref:NAD(P)/FAD-dependent oxidoreductase n=1 Tax=Sphingobium sp. AP50 TaxID=1884369 RepID=UPI0008D24A23|nr:FAD-dependent oxidoreductase [Sphingobium sp. AP50]SEK00732.1 phenylpropionate dioxygenase ferredoxin reductase subunit [Sphingobium sp. AP50]